MIDELPLSGSGVVRGFGVRGLGFSVTGFAVVIGSGSGGSVGRGVVSTGPTNLDNN